MCRPAQMTAQLLVFPVGPTGQGSIQLPHRRIERRAVKASVILKPPWDLRVEHPRQIFSARECRVGIAPHRERPRQEWIEIPVPALVSEETFALAQEQLESNKKHSPRRTTGPTLLQGMLVCRQCGYALYRTSTRTTKRKLHYYRCLGSDAYRHLKGALCSNRPVRQDSLDEFVWSEIIRLLDDPSLIRSEIQRRMEAAQQSDPLRRREADLRRERVRLENSSERLLTAYQEGLLTLAQLRQRMPSIRKQQQAVESELHSLEMAAADQSQYLRLTETLGEFRVKLQARADSLDVAERQKILRLLVKEVLVDSDTITIRHSIPIPQSGPRSGGSPSPNSEPGGSIVPSYLLRSGSHRPAWRRPLLAHHPLSLHQHAGPQIPTYQS